MSAASRINGSNGEIDKEALYGNYLEWQRQQQSLYNDCVRMALDVPPQPGSVSAPKINFINPPQFPNELLKGKTGGLAKLAIGAALATGLGGVGLGALSLLNSDPAEKVIEKIIPGENTDVEIKPGDMIFE